MLTFLLVFVLPSLKFGPAVSAILRTYAGQWPLLETSQKKADVKVFCTFVDIVLLDIRTVFRLNERRQPGGTVGHTIVVIKGRLYDLPFG